MAEEAWVKIQQKTFTKWMNNHLRKKGYPMIENAETDFETGINLMNLINALYGTAIPKHNKKPKMRPHKLDNLTIALKMVEEAKIKTNFLKTTHLLDHDLKMILGMVWAIILDYAIKGISEGDLSAKEGLLMWCRKKTKGYRDVDPPTIGNFTKDWRNGMAFCALIHRHQPNMIDYDSLDSKNAAENLELAFSKAEELGIPRLLDVEDVNVEKPDERSVMTYVSEYFNKFASMGMKEVAAARCAKFLSFLQAALARQNAYEVRARAFLAWCNTFQEEIKAMELGASVELAREDTATLKSMIVDVMPPKTVEKIDLDIMYTEIQTYLKVHDRKEYKCPEDITPHALDEALQAVNGAIAAHSRAVRDNGFQFIKKTDNKISEEKIAEFRASYTHFDTNGKGNLDCDEFKAALISLGIPFGDDKALNALFTEVRGADIAEGGIPEEQWVNYLTKYFQDTDTAEQVTDAFKSLADGRDHLLADDLKCPPITDEQAAFLAGQMAEGENFDYAAFVANNY